MRISDWSSDVCSSDLRSHIREDPISFLVASRTPPLEDSCRVPQPATSGTFSVFPMSPVRNRRQESPHHRARELHAFPRLRSGPLLSRGSSPPSQRSCGSSLLIYPAAPLRSEERRVGTECVVMCRYWWAQEH